MSSLMSADGGAPDARCALCGRIASGPCARCHALVCADCCELTDGGATTFALCLRCVRRGGASLQPGYRDLLRWLAVIVVALAIVAVGLVLLRR